jgi:hypothetical protein
MKRAFSILFITISTIVLLAFTIIPHHHHKGQVCFVMEFCEHDGVINVEHAHHHDIPEEHNTESCVIESGLTVLYFENNTKCCISSHYDYCNDHIHLSPILFLIADLNNFDIDDPFAKIYYGDYIPLFYNSAEANHFHGLRAPPAILS